MTHPPNEALEMLLAPGALAEVQNTSPEPSKTGNLLWLFRRSQAAIEAMIDRGRRTTIRGDLIR
jgi:hypothetical protein